MSKHCFERDWKNDGKELNRRQPINRLQLIARESQEQEEAQIEGWLKAADDLMAKPDPPEPDGDVEPEIA
jgi:hypothetical protein